MSPPFGSISAIEFGIRVAPSTPIELPPPMPTPVLVKSATEKVSVLAMSAIAIRGRGLLEPGDRPTETE